jgi:hypothetical protein
VTARKRVIRRALRIAVITAVFSASVMGAANVLSLSRSAAWSCSSLVKMAVDPAAAVLREAHIAPPIRWGFGAPVSRRVAAARASLTLDNAGISLVWSFLIALVLSVAVATTLSWITRYSSRASRTRGQPCMAA